MIVEYWPSIEEDNKEINKFILKDKKQTKKVTYKNSSDLECSSYDLETPKNIQINTKIK